GSVWSRFKRVKGTTIMAVEYDGGVVIGADSRTTTGSEDFSTHTYRNNTSTNSFYKDVHDHLLKHVLSLVQQILLFLSVPLLTDNSPLVETAAHLFKASCYRYREELTAGILVAGWDRRRGGQVYCVPIGGMLVRQPVSVGGSGSTYIYGFMDSNYKPNMTKEQCLELTASALTLAMERDGSSGGVVRLASISESGVERRVILGNQLPKIVSTH
uniref:proteasome endopeptidase complex n=1 Tax=Neogobius melanostomus TaxID=47308 RepID=A0A8C6T857_9GOBI